MTADKRSYNEPFDFNSRRPKVGGSPEIVGPYAYDARYEQRMHAENVHAPESVLERERREAAKRYAKYKEELAAYRMRQGVRPDGASGSSV